MDEKLRIDWGLLEERSYQTQLGKNLKNTLRKFDKNELFEELNNVMVFYIDMGEELKLLGYKFRVKSLHSCYLKYEKYYPSTEVEKAFNDILGIRIIVSSYSVCDNIEYPSNVRIADMRNGKVKDDGYRGIHVYYQKSHFHYPIEIQFMTEFDRQFNEWLHEFLYKYNKNNEVGIKLREMYENGLIVTEQQFRKEMLKLCAY